MRAHAWIGLGALLGLAGPGGVAVRAPDEAILLVAKEVYPVSAERIADGGVLVRDGKIDEVGRSAGARGARRIEGGSITPGLIDASSTAGLAGGANEESKEVAPALRAIDAFDPRARAVERLARAGVTAVFLAPESRAVIGGLGAVVKTAGEPLDARVVLAAGAVKAAMGDDPSRGNIPVRFGTPTNFYFRRPTTRMGVVWLFRKAFFDAVERRATVARPDPDLVVLDEVLAGTRRLRIAANRLNDIRTALRLAAEFGLAVEIDGGAEAYRCAAELKERGVPVVAGPVDPGPGRRFEVDEPCLANAALLSKAGVRVALTARDRTGEEALPGQALFAMRFGLPFDAALRAVTLDAAAILGVEGRLGSIEPGKDADLVLWEGAPFSSRPLAVLVDGRLVYDAAADPAFAAAAVPR